MNQIRFVVRGQEVGAEEMKRVVEPMRGHAEIERSFEAVEMQRRRQEKEKEDKRAEYVGKQKVRRQKGRQVQQVGLDVRRMVEMWEESLSKGKMVRLSHVRIQG